MNNAGEDSGPEQAVTRAVQMAFLAVSSQRWDPMGATLIDDSATGLDG